MTPQDRTALKQLYAMIWQNKVKKFPNTETRLIAPPKPYNLNKTSQLEKAIVKLLHLYGYNSARITHVVGRQIGADKVTYNHITGRRQTIDKAKFIPSTGRTGEADIHANIMLKDGRPVSLAIEVKNIYTGDRIRPDQLKYKADFEADGGMYIVIRSLSEMFEWVDENLHKKIYY